MSKQVNAVPVATQAQRNKFFSKPFDGYVDDAEKGIVDKLRTSELATGNAFYAQGKACVDATITTAESAKFKRSVDKRATASGQSKPKSEKEQIQAFVTKVSKFSPAGIKLLKALVAAL